RDAAAGTRRHQVAWLYRKSAGAARDGRVNARVLDLDLRLLEQGLVGSYGSFERFRGRHRDVEFLARDELALEQGLQARLLHLGVLKLRHVAGQLRLSLPVRRLVRAGIDLEQQLP